MAQPQLNGAYYGPSIPPPEKSYRRRPSRGDCCCIGSCLRCCCGCIFDLIFSIICKLLCTLLFIAVVVAVILYFIVRPNVVKVHVTSATLSQFNLTDAAAAANAVNNRTLHYNLLLNITIRNPNRRVGIYYDSVEARALYHDSEFASRPLDPFFQHPKNTTALGLSFKGANDVVLGEDKGKKVEDENRSGVFGVDLKLEFKMRFKFGLLKTGKFKPTARCELKVPLVKARGGSNAPVEQFHDTACDWGYRWFWFH